MRQISLIQQKSPCTTNFHDDGPGTLADAEARGEERCPRHAQCWGADGDLHETWGKQCALHFGHQVVQIMHKDRRRFRKVMDQCVETAPTPAGGYIWSDDRKNFSVITDRKTTMEKIEAFAIAIIEGPAQGGIGENAVTLGSTGPVISLAAMQECEGVYGYNGGIGCDMREGFCSCGAGHKDLLKDGI